MRAFVAGLILFAMPAVAQWKIPDELPILPDGQAVCNQKKTHCLVNYSDWMTNELALAFAARELTSRAQGLGEMAEEIERLKAIIVEERAKRVYRCASPQVVP